MTETDKRLMKKMLKTMRKQIEEEDWLNLIILSSNLSCKAIYLRQGWGYKSND